MSRSLGFTNAFLVRLKPVLRHTKDWLPVRYNIHIFLKYEGIPQVRRNPFPGLVREASIEDVSALAQCRNKPERFRERFLQKERCLVAQLENGRIVGYEWFSEPPVHFEHKYRYKIFIPEDAFYLYDAYIIPEFRVKGVWLALKAGLIPIMEAEGKHQLITYISHYNHLSLRTHFRFGFQVYERVSVVRIGNWSFTHRVAIEHTPELVRELSGIGKNLA